MTALSQISAIVKGSANRHGFPENVAGFLGVAGATEVNPVTGADDPTLQYASDAIANGILAAVGGQYVLYSSNIADFAATITAMGSTPATIYINSNVAIADNLDISVLAPNASIVGLVNGKFTVSATKTIKFKAFHSFGLPLSTLFAGAGAYAFGSAVSLIGDGSPESVITAPVGSEYLRTDGGPSATLYIKETGAGNTGWISAATSGSIAGCVILAPDSSVRNIIQPTNAAYVPLTIRGTASQTADLFRVETNASTSLFSVSAEGDIGVAGTLNFTGADKTIDFDPTVPDSTVIYTTDVGEISEIYDLTIKVSGAGRIQHIGEAHFANYAQFNSGLFAAQQVTFGNALRLNWANSYGVLYSDNTGSVVTSSGFTYNGSVFNVTGTVSIGSHLSMLADQDILFADNSGAALTFKEGGNPYLRFVTTNGSENISLFKTLSSTVSGSGTNSAFIVNAVAPTITLSASGGAANSKNWDIQAGATTLAFRTRTDANASGADWLTVTRSGIAISEISFSGPITSSTLVGTGTRLVTSTAAGVLGNETTINGINEFTALQAFASGINFSGNGTSATATITRTAADGLMLRGVTGSSNDFTIFSAAGSAIMKNTAGGTAVNFPGDVSMSALLTVTGNTKLTGLVASGGNVDTTIGMKLAHDNSMTGTTQYELYSSPTFSSAASVLAAAGYFSVATSPTIYTLPTAIGVRIANATIGATSSITNLYGLKVENQSGAGTSYAIHTGTGLVSIGDALIFSANGTGGTGRFYRSAADGIVVRGIAGSSNDFALVSVGGNMLLSNPTGTANITVGHASANANVPGTFSVAGVTTLNNILALSYTSALATIGNGTGSSALIVASAVGGTAEMQFNKGTVSGTGARWTMSCDSIAESGLNAGSGWKLVSRSDTGVVIDNPISVVRAAGGVIAFVRPTAFTGNMIVSGRLNFNGASDSPGTAVNVKDGSIASHGSGAGLFIFGVGDPSGYSSAEYLWLYHNGVQGILTVDKTGTTGSYRPLIIQTGGSASITVATDHSVDLANHLSLAGNIAVNINKFIVYGATGNTEVFGTLNVGGVTQLGNIIEYVDASDFFLQHISTGDVVLSTNAGDIRLEPTGGSTVITGNVSIPAGTLSANGAISTNSGLYAQGGNAPASGSGVEIDYGAVPGVGRIFAYNRTGSAYLPMKLGQYFDLDAGGNIAFNTNKFNVTAETGNFANAGSGSIGTTLAVGTDFAINTNKFNVTGATGNVASAGNYALAGRLNINGATDVANHGVNVKDKYITSTGPWGFVSYGLNTPSDGVHEYALLQHNGVDVRLDVGHSGGSYRPILIRNGGSTAITVATNQAVTLASTLAVTGASTLMGAVTLNNDLYVIGVTHISNIIEYTDNSDFFLQQVATGDIALSTNSGHIRLEPTGGNVKIVGPTVPASASATGSEGEIAWDASYIYVCTATDTWKRAAIVTW